MLATDLHYVETALAAFFLIVFLVIIYRRICHMFETLKAQIPRLMDIIPVLTAHIKALADENAALKQQLADLQAGVADLPALDASLTAAVDDVAALVPPAA